MFFNSSRSIFDPPTLLESFLEAPARFILRLLYHILNSLRVRPKPASHPIRVVCISDIHSKTKEIPDGDLLIVAGDLTDDGTPKDIQTAIEWINSLPHKHKIAIAGNHDYWLDPRAREHLKAVDLSPDHVDWRDIHYLQHSAITLTFPSHGDRQLRVYGAPQIPKCGPDHFAFQYARDHDAWTDTIPADTDILVTHTPPKYHLDLPVALGCQHLLQEIWKRRPQLHVFGHVHAGYGSRVLHWDEAQRAYEVGMSQRRTRGFIRGTLNIRLWICVAQVAVYGVLGLLWDRIWGGKAESCQLINASLTYNSTGKLGNSAQIVMI